MDEPPYLMQRGVPFFIKERRAAVESKLFEYFSRFNGEIPIKIKSRYFEKALDFCERRAELRMNNASSATLADFDHDFLQDVRQSDLNLIDLFHAAGRMQIGNLIDLLFEDVVRIICSMNPEQVEKIFKVRYNGNAKLWCYINFCLDPAPPCPTLSKREQEEVKLHREEIMKVSPADFMNLPATHKLYWVYAHFVLKRNPGMFIGINLLSKEDAAEDEQDEQDEEEESKVPKNHDDVGGPGPRGVAWKTKKTTR